MQNKVRALGAGHVDFLAGRVPRGKDAVFVRVLRDGIDLRMVKQDHPLLGTSRHGRALAGGNIRSVSMKTAIECVSLPISS